MGRVDIWKEMVSKSTQGLVYIHERTDDPGFFAKLVHQLSNQLLSVIFFPNCYPGRRGGWERISREEKVQQLAKEDLGDNLKFAGHETALTALENLLKALRMHSEIPLEPSEFFWTLHTKAQTLIVSHISSVCGCHCWTWRCRSFYDFCSQTAQVASGGKCGLSCANHGYR